MTFEKTCAAANASIASGYNVYQQYVCGFCRTKLEISEPNKFFTKCVCDRCEHITDIREAGCGFVARRD
jgi:hypothetical protein